MSQNEWNSKISNGVYSPNKVPSNLDQSDYNHFELLANNTAASALNKTQRLKLCDYLKIIDSRSTTGNKKAVGKKKGSNLTNIDEQGNKLNTSNPGNITFESLTAIAKIFSNDFKANEDSELDFDDERFKETNIEEIMEENISEHFDKRMSAPEFMSILK